MTWILEFASGLGRALREIWQPAVAAGLASVALHTARVTARSLLQNRRWIIERRRRLAAIKPAPELREVARRRGRRIQQLGLLWMLALLLVLGSYTGIIGYDQGLFWLIGALSGLVFGRLMHAFRYGLSAGRIQAASRIGGLLEQVVPRRSRRLGAQATTGLLLIILAAGLVGAASPAAAQGADDETEELTCDASVTVNRTGILQPFQRSLSLATADAPLIVDIATFESVSIEWKVPQSVEGTEWTVSSFILFRSIELTREATSSDLSGEIDRGNEELEDEADIELALIPPGKHKLIVDVPGICENEEAYIFVRCPADGFATLFSPNDNGVSQVPGTEGSAGEQLIGAACSSVLGSWFALSVLLLLQLLSGYAIWSSRSLSGITVEVYDPQSGHLARGSLHRGKVYTARVGLSLPDPIDSYVSDAGSLELELTLEQSNGETAWQRESVDAHLISTDFRLEIPSEPNRSVEVRVELWKRNRLISSVELVEQPRRWFGKGCARIATVASVETGSRAADRINQLTKVDGSVLFSATETHLTIRSVHRSGPNSTSRRSSKSISLAEAHYLRTRYEKVLSQSQVNRNDSGPHVAKDAAFKITPPRLSELARIGQETMNQLLGSETEFLQSYVKRGGKVELVALDHRAADLVLPWGAVYLGDGGVDDSDESDLCSDYGNNEHYGEVCSTGQLCPSMFLGVRAELMSAAAQKLVRRSYTADAVREVIRSPRHQVRKEASRKQGLQVVEVINSDFEHDYDLHASDETLEKKRIGAPGSRDLLRHLVPHFRRADVIHLFGHGGPSGGSLRLANGIALTSADFEYLGWAKCFNHHPIVIINACSSGVATLTTPYAILGMLAQQGVGAALVTESKVQTRAGSRVVGSIIEAVLEEHGRSGSARIDGRFIRRHRQKAIFESNSLAPLAYSYYEFRGRTALDRPSSKDSSVQRRAFIIRATEETPETTVTRQRPHRQPSG